MAQGVWTHFAITWDGQIKRLYIDGQLAGEESAMLAFDRSDIVIGGDIDNGNFNFALDGFLDEIRIYRRPLTASEIATAAGL